MRMIEGQIPDDDHGSVLATRTASKIDAGDFQQQVPDRFTGMWNRSEQQVRTTETSRLFIPAILIPSASLKKSDLAYHYQAPPSVSFSPDC